MNIACWFDVCQSVKMNAKKPKSIKELKSYIGSVNWFRGFIEKLAEKSFALTNSLRIKIDKEWKWTEMMDKEMRSLKKLQT